MARSDNQPEKNPHAGGSYIRHPVTGDLNPNLDDHAMAARDAEVKTPAADSPAPAAAGAGPEVDVALDALEGSLICATGGPNALSCVALAERGKILRCPDAYMDKIACGALGGHIREITARRGWRAEPVSWASSAARARWPVSWPWSPGCC